MWIEEPEVVTFLQAVVAMGPFAEIVELGSYAMHDHDARPLFPGARYVGVDNRAGPGVDVQALAHRYARDHKRTADLVLSISALEHDPHWTQTVWGAVDLLRPDGIVALSYPIEDWGEHETDCAPDGVYYANPDPEKIMELLALQCEIVAEWTSLRSCLPQWPRHNVIARRR